ncbi:MAG: ATP-binding protein, partial [Spirochaetota bacterium]
GQMAQIVEPLGLNLSFLRNTKNWVSYDYYNRLLVKLVEVTGDERAPGKAPFSMKPQEAYEYLLYATYTTLWSGSPRWPYRIIFKSDFYTRWTKIGTFEVVSSSANSMKLKLTLKNGYKQTRYNCDVVQGLLSSIPGGMGLPPAKVTELQCAVNGSESCIYAVSWQNRKKWQFLLGLPTLIALLILETVVFRNFFGIKDIIITILAYGGVHFLIQSYQFWKSFKLQEETNTKHNRYLKETLEKIEDEYNELLYTKIRLEERNTYLSIVNAINEKIVDASSFDSLLFDVAHILMERLKLEKIDFFQFNSERKVYSSLFGTLSMIEEYRYKQLIQKGYSLPVEAVKPILTPSLFEWIGRAEKTASLYIVPVSLSDTYSGFFCFLRTSSQTYSREFTDSLFENISTQLKVGFMKLSSRIVIFNILSSIPAHVLIFDTSSFSVRYVNNFFIDTFPGLEGGYTQDSVTGKSLFTILPFDNTARHNVVKALQLLDERKKPEVFETSMASSAFEYSLFSIPQYTGGEKLAGIILSDVTEARSFQQKLLFNEELLALGRVATGIAHEINNPLYAVLANAEEIADNENVGPEFKQFAEEIVEHVINISNIIKDLSKYSKTLRRTELDEVDLNTVIDESLRLVEYSSNFLEVKVVKLLSEIPVIKAIKGEMQQVFINLFNNAIQAMDGRGTLTITSSASNNEILISVSDTGKGIEEKDMPYIFDLFYTTKKGEGTGQGLHIVKKIVTKNNGKITVESRQEKGATFSLNFKLESIT